MSAGRLFALVLGAVALVFLAANAHLVYVASESQPDCVAEGEYRPARPVC